VHANEYEFISNDWSANTLETYKCQEFYQHMLIWTVSIHWSSKILLKVHQTSWITSCSEYRNMDEKF
jgi:hypothetical protein